MIKTDLVWLALADGTGRGTLNPDGSPMRRSAGEAYLARDPHPPQILVPVDACVCCGSISGVNIAWRDGWRCERHRESVPCRVEGCKRTAPRAKYRETICAQHWRAGVPPGSEARRVWNRYHRIVKRFGWTPERGARGDRLWEWLVHRCQAAAAGDIDQREIDRMFGWAA